MPCGKSGDRNPADRCTTQERLSSPPASKAREMRSAPTWRGRDIGGRFGNLGTRGDNRFWDQTIAATLRAPRVEHLEEFPRVAVASLPHKLQHIRIEGMECRRRLRPAWTLAFEQSRSHLTGMLLGGKPAEIDDPRLIERLCVVDRRQMLRLPNRLDDSGTFTGEATHFSSCSSRSKSPPVGAFGIHP